MSDEGIAPARSAAPYGERINGLIPDELTPDVRNAIGGWKQGDALEGGPLFWAGPQGSDPYLPYDGAPQPFHVSEEPGSGLLVLTSQTCDIATTGTGAKHPLVTVSPVYKLADADPNYGNAKAGRIGYLVRITKPPTGDGLYVADLRITLPISKGVLVNSVPIDLWATEQDRLHFAECLARKYGRPALSSALSEGIVNSLSDHIKQNDADASERIEEFRLRIEGDRLTPVTIQLIVLTDVEPDRDLKKVWRAWTKKGARLLKPEGIGLLPTLVITPEKCSARVYMNSVPLRVSALGR